MQTPPPSAWRDWRAAGRCTVVRTIDAHAEGEPLRVVLDGLPALPGETVLEMRRHAKDRLDHLRTGLMWEPRGHADMYGCLLTPPTSRDADFGVLFLHNEGYSTMCGHGIIAVATVVLETGVFPMRSPTTDLRIDTPAGLVTARANIEDERVTSVAFRNVPSFVQDLDRVVDVPGLGAVRYDLAFGGAFYAYVRAADLGLRCGPDDVRRLIGAGRAIKQAVAVDRPPVHPSHPELGFLYGTIFTEEARSPDAHSRNVCIFADGEVDRSPTGTGVSGRLAILHARGEIATDQAIAIESLIGSRFTGRVVAESREGPHPAIIPEVEGRAWITGRHEFVIDPFDPFARGFLLR